MWVGLPLLSRTKTHHESRQRGRVVEEEGVLGNRILDPLSPGKSVSLNLVPEDLSGSWYSGLSRVLLSGLPLCLSCLAFGYHSSAPPLRSEGRPRLETSRRLRTGHGNPLRQTYTYLTPVDQDRSCTPSFLVIVVADETQSSLDPFTSPRRVNLPCVRPLPPF